LDVVSKDRGFAKAADASIGIGLVGAAGAAITGVTDWQDVDPPARRIGMIHGMLNVTATALFATSLILRKRKSRISGRILAGLGYGVMAYAAHLGGKMVYDYRVGVDRTDGEGFPSDFVAVMPETKLPEAKPTRAEHDGVPILLIRRGDRIFALAETCSHFSAPLSEGELVGDSIVCPWHKSRFALEDGRVLDGPAVHPQPCLEVRVQNGQIEVRKPLCNIAIPTPPTATDTVVSGQPA
jgi:nitrite reductase/ring-hydroxylating ferredoxin subunit